MFSRFTAVVSDTARTPPTGCQPEKGTTMKKVIAGLALGAMLVVGGSGLAFAADAGSSDASTPAPAAPAAHPRVRALVRFRHNGLEVVLKTLDVSKDDLRAALKGGQTVGQFADAHGSSAQAVIDELVKAGTDAVNQAVSDGKLDATRAQRILTRLPQAASRLVSRQWTGHAATTSVTV
jgi:hypothetical protein